MKINQKWLGCVIGFIFIGLCVMFIITPSLVLEGVINAVVMGVVFGSAVYLLIKKST